ncbi:MAG TPA: right-handed parallel beta-helix repeat-containing protein [Candidatus Hydrogenedentes bacterium]|nr:right-handed parallel beta-helix repeat-containing protein [Candidatus Hydrogenedentota bacterium]
MLNRISWMIVMAGLVSIVVIIGAYAQTPVTFYVALNGNDAWSGKLSDPNAEKNDGPFATLERAREAVRMVKQAGLPVGGVQVLMRGGLYALDKPFELGAEDSGTQEAPIVYGAAPDEEVRLVGGKAVNAFQLVTDPDTLNRLDESARGKVVQADLKALGITEFGSPEGGGLEVFFKNQPMTVSRWPNEGFVKIVDLVEKDGHKIHGIPGSKVGKFKYEGDRPKRWKNEKEGWLHGYWFWDWSDQRQRIESIDTENSILSVVPPYHGYGYRKGQWYYAFNLLCELDAPGEWHLDRETGVLYFWPPSPIENGDVVVSVLPSLLNMKDASHLTIQGLTLEAARGTAVSISGGTQVCMGGCIFRNMGGSAVGVSGGTRNRVAGCDIYNMGGGGISLSGGDLASLTPAELVAENNHIHHYGRWYRMYQSAIALNGVGNRVANNLIHDAPHIAIVFGGNDHIIEFNEIHHVCQESNDAGAIYAGRNWTTRGTIIRHNYLHEITGFEGRGCVGVYLDDMYCGTSVFGNVFYKVTNAAFIGGGRDNSVENNIFVECSPALHVDARALGWAGYHADEWIKEAQEKGTHLGIAFTKPPYSERYPKLLQLMEDEPKAPKGNVIARNIFMGGKWDDIEDKARPLLTLQDNMINEDPHFVDTAKQDFRLKDDSPAFTVGFRSIPIEEIGLAKDRFRNVLP